MAKKMHADKSMCIGDICKTLRISKPTFYRTLDQISELFLGELSNLPPVVVVIHRGMDVFHNLKIIIISQFIFTRDAKDARDAVFLKRNRGSWCLRVSQPPGKST